MFCSAKKFFLILIVLAACGARAEEEGGGEGAAVKTKLSADEQGRVDLEKKVLELENKIKQKESEADKLDEERNSTPEDSPKLKEITQAWVKLKKEIVADKAEYKKTASELKFSYPKKEGPEKKSESDEAEVSAKPRAPKKLSPAVEKKIKENLDKIDEVYK